jgi:hypothetical protein
MKNQYFGDIHDYRKYGLLRSIIEATQLRLLVAWMLTPDDGGSDGSRLSYLNKPSKWGKHDPELFDWLHDILFDLQDPEKRGVHLIEKSEMLPLTQYFSEEVSDQKTNRSAWLRSLEEQAKNNDFVFLDPDNGIEVKSKSYGHTNSSKYVYWREIKPLWDSGKSLLIYQHFIREKRPTFIQRMLTELHDTTPNSLVEAFRTSDVLFLLALQPNHQKYHENIVRSVQSKWKGQIDHCVFPC